MLRLYLRQTQNGSISQIDLSKFVQFARILTTSYLSSFRTSAAILCDTHGISLTDLAYDCIADLFARDSDGLFVHLDSFVGVLDRPIDQTPDHELLAAFRSLLSRFAEMQLGRLYAQADPGGARIHRNIRECIKKQAVFRLSRDLRGWIITTSVAPNLDHLPPCSSDWLRAEFHSHLDGVKQIPQLMDTLHQVLMSQTEYRRSIPLNEVVQLFKGVYQLEQNSGLEEQEFQDLDGLTQFEIDQLCAHVQRVLKEKILVTYVAHGKIDRKQGEAMYLAHCDLIRDWCSGDRARSGLYEYLKRYFPVEEQVYKIELRAKMEYLMKVAREEFASRLMGDI